MEVLTWKARTEKNLTLRELEAITGISRSTLNTIENGQTSPTLRQLETIAEALDTTISALYESSYKNRIGYPFIADQQCGSPSHHKCIQVFHRQKYIDLSSHRAQSHKH